MKGCWIEPGLYSAADIGHVGRTFHGGLQECVPDFTLIISGQKRIVNDAEDVKSIIFPILRSLSLKNIPELGAQNVRCGGCSVDPVLRDHTEALSQRFGHQPEVFQLEAPQVGCQRIGAGAGICQVKDIL